VGLWKNIRGGVCFIVIPVLFWEMGLGSDFGMMWCGEMPLKEAFPVLYGIACDKNALDAAHLVLESDSIQWDVSFICAAHDWEVDVLDSFFTLLFSIRVDREREDQLWWSPSHKGKFDVRSFCKVLTCKEVVHFP
jgi:hypothetical protein